MNNNDFKKYKELQAVQPLMKKLGYDVCKLENMLIPSEEPDFLFKHEDQDIGLEVTECHPENTKGKGAKKTACCKAKNLRNMQVY